MHTLFFNAVLKKNSRGIFSLSFTPADYMQTVFSHSIRLQSQAAGKSKQFLFQYRHDDDTESNNLYKIQYTATLTSVMTNTMTIISRIKYSLTTHYFIKFTIIFGKITVRERKSESSSIQMFKDDVSIRIRPRTHRRFVTD